MREIALVCNTDVVQKLVAMHKNTLPDTLWHLGLNGSFDVKLALLENGNTPLDVLETLAKSSPTFVHTTIGLVHALADITLAIHALLAYVKQVVE